MREGLVQRARMQVAAPWIARDPRVAAQCRGVDELPADRRDRKAATAMRAAGEHATARVEDEEDAAERQCCDQRHQDSTRTGARSGSGQHRPHREAPIRHAPRRRIAAHVMAASAPKAGKRPAVISLPPGTVYG